MRGRFSVDDVEAEARSRLDPCHYDFFAGAAGSEWTRRANESAWSRRPLRPRILGGGGRDLTVRVLGRSLSMPVLVSPTAFHRLAHPEGEVATARAVAAAGTLLIVSMAATRTLEDIAAAAREGAGDGDPALWFQLYPQPDEDFTTALVRRAEAAGCAALVATVDSPVFGFRERDHHNGFHDLPAGLRCENLVEPGPPERVRSIAMDPGLDWARIDRLIASTRLPVVLKGVLHPEDARLAVDHGAAGVIVSNHGGRQLDGAVASADALPDVVAAVAGRIPVLIDGGVRRGADVVRALALGAVAVGVGRPVLWGLAVDGAAGVREVLELLRDDVDRTLALCGGGRVADLDAGVLFPSAPAPADGRVAPVSEKVS
jgi:4-hydroxymandelate oxidase